MKVVNAFLLFGLCAGTICAESFWPFQNERFVDAAGDYYAVVKRQAGPQRFRDGWGPVEVTIAQRKADSPRVARVRSKLVHVENIGFVFDMEAGNDVDVRRGDMVHGRAKVTHPPSTVLVSSTGLGVVLLDLYGLDSMLLAKGVPAVTVHSLNGKVAHTAKLQDLFPPAEWGNFTITMSGCVWWLRAAWIDEERREVVMVAGNESRTSVYPLAVLRLDTGAIRRGSSQDVLRAIATRNPGGLTPALAAAIKANLKETSPHLKAILQDAAQPLDARLRCAVFLSSMGDTSGKELLATSAVTVSKQFLQHPDWQNLENDRLSEISAYAIKHLPDVLGDECLPVLREVARMRSCPVTLYESFRRMGSKAVPVLIDTLEDPDDPEGQVLAADVLPDITPISDAAITAIARALESPAKTESGRQVRRVAARSLGQIGAPARSAVPALVKLAHDEDEKVRMAAMEAIARIQGWE